MNTVDLCRRVIETATAHHFRERPGGGLDAHPWTEEELGAESGWILMDLFSAGVIVAVWNNLNATNRAKLQGLHPVQAQDVCLALLDRAKLGRAH